MSTYKVAGVSRLKGEFKVRFANDMTRVKVLAKNGHSDIDMIELKEPMTKEDAIAFLIGIDFDNGNAEVRAALESAVETRAVKSKTDKPAKAPKVKAEKTKPTLESIAAKAPAKKTAPKSTVTKAEIEALLAESEEAPF